MIILIAHLVVHLVLREIQKRIFLNGWIQNGSHHPSDRFDFDFPNGTWISRKLNFLKHEFPESWRNLSPTNETAWLSTTWRLRNHWNNIRYSATSCWTAIYLCSLKWFIEISLNWYLKIFKMYRLVCNFWNYCNLWYMIIWDLHCLI